MKSPRRIENADLGTHGFVLVGVVMMVLALTILGLSLFSLSSYEAQFMNRSLDEAQALQYAMGGLDRARFALSAPPDTLGQIKQFLPLESVTHAVAAQARPGISPDTSGPIQWGGNDVVITVTAKHRGVTRRVSGSYIPTSNPTDNYYKRLMTVAAGGISVNDTVGFGLWPSCGSVNLGSAISPDSVWESSLVPGWLGCANAPGGTYGVNPRFVPVPSVASFLSAHPPGPGVTLMPAIPQDTGNNYFLNGAYGVVRFWYTPAGPEFSTRTDGSLTVTVNGRAVWLLPKGIRTDGFLRIVSGGDPDACLVIIAQDGEDTTYGLFGAIWPFAGFQADIPVVLVTDGSVKLEHFNAINGLSRADNISIYAHHVLLTGPTTDSGQNPAGNRMDLSYGATVMDPLIDELAAAGALPDVSGGGVGPKLTLRRGTWRVLQ